MQMSNLSSKCFLSGLFLIFFGAIGLDVFRIVLGVDKDVARYAIYIISAALLSLLLYIRLGQVHRSRIWAVLGIVQPLGLALGLYLYVSQPRLSEQSSKDA